MARGGKLHVHTDKVLAAAKADAQEPPLAAGILLAADDLGPRFAHEAFIADSLQHYSAQLRVWLPLLVTLRTYSLFDDVKQWWGRMFGKAESGGAVV